MDVEAAAVGCGIRAVIRILDLVGEVGSRPSSLKNFGSNLKQILTAAVAPKLAPFKMRYELVRGIAVELSRPSLGEISEVLYPVHVNPIAFSFT